MKHFFQLLLVLIVSIGSMGFSFLDADPGENSKTNEASHASYDCGSDYVISDLHLKCSKDDGTLFSSLLRQTIDNEVVFTPNNGYKYTFISSFKEAPDLT